MKALKRSLEWKGPIKNQKNKDGSDLVITPYSRRTSLQIHVKGYTKDGVLVQARYGNGDETLFVNLGFSRRSKEDIVGQARLIHDMFMLSPKMDDEILVTKAA